MLVGLIRAPSLSSPLRDVAVARARAEIVLDSMVANGTIDARTAANAKANPAEVNTVAAFAQTESWFADWVAQGWAQDRERTWAIRADGALSERHKSVLLELYETYAREHARDLDAQVATPAAPPAPPAPSTTSQ